MSFLMGVLSTIFKIDEEINNWNRNSLDDENIVRDFNIRYTEGQYLDTYYSKAVKGKFPVVINIHGGGWLVGDKKWRKGIAIEFAKAGFFVINPNYSLSPTTLYPACIRDLMTVFDYIEDNAIDLNLDLDRIYVTGDSAGAHLAGVVAGLQNNEGELERLGLKVPLHKIDKAALFCGIYDYDKCVHKQGAQGLAKDMTGYDIKVYKEEFEYAKLLSPVNFVDAKYPSTYLVSAPLDIFCDGQAEIMEAKLKKNNVECKHYIPKDKLATHCFHLNLNRDDSIEAIAGAIKHFKY